MRRSTAARRISIPSRIGPLSGDSVLITAGTYTPGSTRGEPVLIFWSSQGRLHNLQGNTVGLGGGAMIEVDAWLQESAFDACMVMQVHDELVFEVGEGQVDEFIGEVKSRMQAAAELSVPLIVEAESGVNWDEAH